MRFFLFCVSVVIVLSVNISCSKDGKEIKVEQSIQNGINYLSKKQLPWGGFQTDRCINPDMTRCVQDKTLFIPVLIGLAVHDIESEEMENVRKILIKLFLSQLPELGAWEFYYNVSVDDIDHPYYFPDLDDTSMILYFLRKNHVEFDEQRVISVIENNKKDGLYLTSLYDYQPPAPQTWNVDSVINAEAMMVLQLQDEKVCAFINDMVINKSPSSNFYRESAVLYYMLVRTYVNGVQCIKPSITYLRNELKDEKSTILKSPMLSAVYLTSELTIEPASKSRMNEIARSLVSSQRKDGSWPAGYFFHGGDPNYFHGSEDLTTALAIESLNRFNLSPDVE